jgi:hypothetical protein
MTGFSYNIFTLDC